MRKEFCETIERIAGENKEILFLTGDLGFMALEGIRDKLNERFINMGVAEQNMISVAAGLASQGLIPLCYSIAPFVVYRPLEQIRLDVCLHNMNVKIIGNGGGYGYGIMGATHHALEDLAMLSSLQNMRCFIPFCNEDVSLVVEEMLKYKGPSYLRLGFANKPKEISLPPYSALRRIDIENENENSDKKRVTVVALGPITINVLNVIADAIIKKEKLQIDLFAVSEMPIFELSTDFLESLKSSGRLMILEEHVARGGVAENLALLLMKESRFRVDFDFHSIKMKHFCAQGYQELYGDQKYHQRLNQLDPDSIAKNILLF
ncbi:MAG: transketolase [Oligoflexia bacterium]|nr:transketolase [Oligoflexia bacterium]